MLTLWTCWSDSTGQRPLLPICLPPVMIPTAAARSVCGNQRVISELIAGDMNASDAPTARRAETANQKLSCAFSGISRLPTRHSDKLAPTIHLPLIRSAYVPVNRISNEPAFCAASTRPSYKRKREIALKEILDEKITIIIFWCHCCCVEINIYSANQNFFYITNIISKNINFLNI